MVHYSNPKISLIVLIIVESRIFQGFLIINIFKR